MVRLRQTEADGAGHQALRLTDSYSKRGARSGGVRGVRVTEPATLVGVTAGVQGVVIVKPERGAVKVVRARLCDGIKDSTRIAPILGAELIRDEPHFLDRVGIIERDRRPRNAKVVVVLAVDHEVVRAYTPAVHRETGAGAGEGSLSGIQLANARRREGNAVDIAVG